MISSQLVSSCLAKIEENPKIVFCLMGPTASGKTDLAISLLEYLPSSIVSVDSAMIYRGMDIGTAKPSKATQQKAPHRLLDIIDPSERYSVAKFLEDVEYEIKSIQQANRIPLLVGGTMLYFYALQHGLSQLPTTSPEVRESILNDAKTKGWQNLHDELKMLDPKTAERINPNDNQRIQRALEVYRTTGKTLSETFETKIKPNHQFHNMVIFPEDRSLLHERIEKRFHEMLSIGFIDEVQGLYQRGDLSLNLPSMRSVGYRQVWQYLDGHIDHEDMVLQGIAATRQLAKRQLTWLRQKFANVGCSILEVPTEIRHRVL